MGGEFLVRNQMQKLQPLEPMFHHGLFGSLFLQTIPKLHSKRKLLEPQRTGEARKGHTHTLRFPLVSAIDMFIVKAGLDEMDNVVLRLEAQIRWGCLWMHTEQVDD